MHEGLPLQQRVLGQRAFPLTPWGEGRWSAAPYVSPSHEPDGSECEERAEYYASMWWISRFYDPYDDDDWEDDWD